MIEHRDYPPVGERSPHGDIVIARLPIEPGLAWLSTELADYLWLSPAQVKLMPGPLALIRFERTSLTLILFDGHWYAHRDALIPIIGRAQMFSPETLNFAVRLIQSTAAQYHPFARALEWLEANPNALALEKARRFTTDNKPTN